MITVDRDTERLTSGGYSLERLRRFWTSPGKQGRDEKLYQVPKNSEDHGDHWGSGLVVSA